MYLIQELKNSIPIKMRLGKKKILVLAAVMAYISDILAQIAK